MAAAADDPRRLAEINERYADLLTRIGEETPHLRLAALGVRDSETPVFINQGSGPPTRPRGVVSDVDFEYPEWLKEALEEARRKRIDAGLPPWEPGADAEGPPQDTTGSIDDLIEDLQRDRAAALGAAADLAGGAKALSEAGLEIGYDPVNNVLILATGQTLTGHEANRYLALLTLATPIAMIVGGKIVRRLSTAERLSFPSSRALRANLEAAGFVRPANAAAHHIVAGGAQRAAEAQAILKRFGMDINDAANGVFLLRNTRILNPPPGAVHSSLHSSAYYREVELQLGRATNREDAVRILNSIRERLLAGRFP